MKIRGFGVPGLKRTKLRSPISGVYGGYRWEVECAEEGLFQWRAGKLSGWTLRSSTLGHALADVRDAVDLMVAVEERYSGDGLSREDLLARLHDIGKAMWWAKQAAKGALDIQTKRRKNGSVYYLVEECKV